MADMKNKQNGVLKSRKFISKNLFLAGAVLALATAFVGYNMSSAIAEGHDDAIMRLAQESNAPTSLNSGHASMETLDTSPMATRPAPISTDAARDGGVDVRVLRGAEADAYFDAHSAPKAPEVIAPRPAAPRHVAAPIEVPHTSPSQDPASEALATTTAHPTNAVQASPRHETRATAALPHAGRGRLQIDTDIAAAAEQTRRIYLMDPNLPEDQFLQINGEYGTRSFNVMLPDSREGTSYSLYIGFENSVDVFPLDSRLLVNINGYQMADLRLDANQGLRQIAIDFPSGVNYSTDSAARDARFHQGMNEITFVVEQSHRVECTLEGTYDLWTRIAPHQTFLEVTGAADRTDMILSNMGSLLGSSFYADEPLTILSPYGDDDRDIMTVDNNAITWGALASQGYALRIGGVTPHVEAQILSLAPQENRLNLGHFPNIDQSDIEGHKNILIGLKEDVRSYLGREIVSSITGPFIGIYPLDTDPSKFIIVFSGETEADLLEALTAFADPLFDFPEQRNGIGFPMQEHVVVEAENADSGNVYFSDSQGEEHLVVQSGGDYGLNAFGYEETYYRGLRQIVRMPVYMPPDFYVSDDSRATLNLNADYAKNLDDDAFMNIFVNGEIADGVSLAKMFEGIAGGESATDNMYQLNDFEVNIPLRLFRPGLNIIEIESKLSAGHSTDCGPGPIASEGDHNVRLVIYEDSVLSFPEFPRLAVLPDLRLFADTAFPFFQQTAAEMRGINLFVPRPQEAELGAAWTIVAKLAQQARHVIPVDGMMVWEGMRNNNDALIIGAYNDINNAPQSTNFFNNAPVSSADLQAYWSHAIFADPLTMTEEVYYANLDRIAQNQTSYSRSAVDELERRTRVERRAVTFSDRFGQWSRNFFNVEEPSRRIDNNVFLSRQPNQPSAAIMQYRSLHGVNTTWTMLTARDSQYLEAAATRLVTPQYWNRMDGEIMVFGADIGNLDTREAAEEQEYFVYAAGLSPSNARLIISNWFSVNIITWMLFIGLLIIVLSLMTYMLVNRTGQYNEQEEG